MIDGSNFAGVTFNAASHSYLIDGKPAPGTHEIFECNGIKMPNVPAIKEGAARGTNVDIATELYDTGRLDESDPWMKSAERGYLDSWIKFRSIFQPKILARQNLQIGRAHV